MNDVPLDEIVITAGDDTGEDETKRGRGTQRTASPLPKAQAVRAAVRAMCSAIGGDVWMAASRPPHGQTRGMPITAARSLWAAASVLAQ